MSASFDAQIYQQFHQMLGTLEAEVKQANPEARSLQVQFLEMQQWFQQQIMAADLSALATQQANLLQSIHIEVNKQLRLLGTDVMFFQAARQPLKRQQRQSQMGDRIHLLRTYCDHILEALREPG
jgi:hypothetical protein